MSQDCCTPNGNVMILACSGGSNVGQLSNQAAVELTREGYGKMFCLAGMGARFGIRSIPVQAFFDSNGREVFRHEGFYPQAEIEKKLAAMGVS